MGQQLKDGLGQAWAMVATFVPKLVGFLIVLLIGWLIAKAVSKALGLVLGTVAGYIGRWVDNVLIVVMDTLQAFPAVILALALLSVLGPSLRNVIVVIAVLIPIALVNIMATAAIKVAVK